VRRTPDGLTNGALLLKSFKKMRFEAIECLDEGKEENINRIKILTCQILLSKMALGITQRHHEEVAIASLPKKKKHVNRVKTP
jgi:hypothetical protein